MPSPKKTTKTIRYHNVLLCTRGRKFDNCCGATEKSKPLCVQNPIIAFMLNALINVFAFFYAGWPFVFGVAAFSLLITVQRLCSYIIIHYYQSSASALLRICIRATRKTCVRSSYFSGGSVCELLPVCPKCVLHQHQLFARTSQSKLSSQFA